VIILTSNNGYGQKGWIATVRQGSHSNI